jgi:hypothetical protein
MWKKTFREGVEEDVGVLGVGGDRMDIVRVECGYWTLCIRWRDVHMTGECSGRARGL